jgi:LmbE family N-acetylglucosaminyl deacetylase
MRLEGGGAMSVLVIAPHPDDEAIGCGGAILRHVVADRLRVTVAFLTSGERGLPLPVARAQRVREREAEEAASVLGLAAVSFLRLPDTLVARHFATAVAALKAILASEKPERIYVPHPADDHVDHAASLPILWAAMGDPSPDNLSPNVLGYEVWTPMSSYDDGADISSVMAAKLRAVRCHRSQVELLRYDRAVRGLNAFRGALAWKCRYAEVYRHLFPGLTTAKTEVGLQ